MEVWHKDGALWGARVNPSGAPYEVARLLKDPVAGMELIRVRYAPGSVTPDHRHPCAHGLVVLEGQLLTQSGIFGPGDVVWYAEGEWGSHGATALGPVTALIVSNKPFSVEYREDHT
jgi:quercetin dioxygenase-like cupin family protein